jgi:hypothetical protein
MLQTIVSPYFKSNPITDVYCVFFFSVSSTELYELSSLLTMTSCYILFLPQDAGQRHLTFSQQSFCRVRACKTGRRVFGRVVLEFLRMVVRPYSLPSGVLSLKVKVLFSFETWVNICPRIQHHIPKDWNLKTWAKYSGEQ